jgi:nucleoside-diphosphate-sugar epimerase
MTGATVFVTGGSGFLGSRLIPALTSRGYRVRALARSAESVAVIAQRGAQPITADLADASALTGAMTGCSHVLHCAARHRQGGSPAAFHRDNVAGTENALAAAQAAGVTRFLMVGAAMSLLGGPTIENADETWPLHEPRYSAYARTKTIADRKVLAADREGFTTCVVRPGWIWGSGDPQSASIVDAARIGRLRLIDGGRYPIVTSHIDNTVHAIDLALQRGAHAQAYYVFDDGTIEIRDFLARILAVHGIPAPTRSIPRRAAWIGGTMMDHAWTILRRPGQPPVSRLMVAVNGGPFLVSDNKARHELGYTPVITRDQAFRVLTP